MDFYTAEKLVGYKQAELRAEAAQAALDAAWVRDRLQSIGAMTAAAGLLRRGATRVWSRGVKGSAPLPEAGQ
jgi:hypothetical protein